MKDQNKNTLETTVESQEVKDTSSQVSVNPHQDKSPIDHDDPLKRYNALMEEANSLKEIALIRKEGFLTYVKKAFAYSRYATRSELSAMRIALNNQFDRITKEADMLEEKRARDKELKKLASKGLYSDLALKAGGVIKKR